MKKIHYLYALSFLSAFLLFQIELIIAKVLLPRFGGSYLVWGACMVFFQFALLGGYGYAHIVIKKFGMFKYSRFHFAVLLLPLLFFPGRPLPGIISHSHLPLVIDIFLQLSLTIGLAFFVLSTISLVTQSWLSHSELPEQRNPFMLYAISNIGSFLGLLSYPFFFELRFDLDTQLAIWRILYLLFIALYLIALAAIRVTDRSVSGFRMFTRSLFVSQYRFADEALRQRLTWFLLSAAGCVVFLSVTNVMTYEIAPCPLLWIIPLGIYLASFTLTFRDRPLCPRWIRDRFPLVMGMSVLLFFFAQGRILPVSPQLIAFAVSLFSLCLYCQYELYQSRPKEKGDLTGFYLWISFGGFAGSFLVTWIVPLLFTTPVEFLLGLFLIGLALLVKQGGSRPGLPQWRFIVYLLCLLAGWPLVFVTYNVFGVMLIVLGCGVIFAELGKRAGSLCMALLLILMVAPFSEYTWGRDGKLISSYRNYYGIYKVHFRWPVLSLMNGTTVHGAQYLGDDQGKMNEPLSYYHRNTPVGKLLGSDAFPTGRIGIIGLGIGTLSAYGKQGGVIDFFELDPDLSFIVKAFDYLQNSRAQVNVTYEDARLALNRIPGGTYDILVVDAFSGDSVPVHLLTTEAIREYRERLKGHGIILFHISNRYLDLIPVLFSNARVVGAFALADENNAESDIRLASLWVALTWDGKSNATLISRQWKERAALKTLRPVRPWTDQYSNILSVLKPEVLLHSIKTFAPFAW